MAKIALHAVDDLRPWLVIAVDQRHLVFILLRPALVGVQSHHLDDVITLRPLPPLFQTGGDVVEDKGRQNVLPEAKGRDGALNVGDDGCWLAKTHRRHALPIRPIGR
ncbi:hypothetical protein TYRP_012523 [Tyrophagus putrescentiae]|nr:hypothetical protein TYRP_012523 [Tyrophagus putrescentiae]